MRTERTGIGWVESTWSRCNLTDSGMTSWIKLIYTTEQTPGRVCGTHSRQNVWKITLSEYRDFLIKSNTKLFFIATFKFLFFLLDRDLGE